MDMDHTSSDLSVQAKQNALAQWFNANPNLASRGIDEPMWNALCTSIYPGAKPDSIMMAVDYCNARNLDIMLKPVHLVPMNVKDAQNNSYAWRDVPMPGIGLYRIQAERTKNYAGADAAEFGPEVTETLVTKGGAKIDFTFPEWCKYTVYKQMAGGQIVSYTAIEYWKENYANEGGTSTAPNSMWKKRPRAQLAKCTEAQVLRKAWPEVGQEATAEEMEGKAYVEAKDVTPNSTASTQAINTSEKVSLNQIATLIEAAKGAGLDESYVCSVGNVKEISDLSAIRFEPAMKHLKAKLIKDEIRL
jgi:phage recombination protein Bet